MGVELACVRLHHRLFLVSLLGYSSSLLYPRHRIIDSSLDWMDDSVEHPSTLILDLFSLSHFSSFHHRFPNCSRTCSPHSLFFASFPPPPSPSLNLSQSLSLAWIQGSSRTDNIHIHMHKTQVIHPTSSVFFSSFEVHHSSSAIPSRPIIHIHIHMFIPLHRHRAYNHHLQHRHLYTTSTHQPTHGQPTP